MIYLLWLVVFLITLALYLKQVYSRFSKYGVKNCPVLPVVGNVLDSMLLKLHMGDEYLHIYNSFPEERFVGRFEFMKSVVVVRDTELAKKIAIKDFEHFLDHRTMVDASVEPLFGRNLFSLKGQEWKDMRATLSPAFTSSKMRVMVPFMMEVNDHMTNSLKRQIKATGTDYIDLDCKDLTSRYANDVIACCTFGLKVDSHTDGNNQFYAMGRETVNVGLRWKILFVLYTSFPKIMKKLKIKLLSEATHNFFKNLITCTMKEREEKHIMRPDMIHLLMEAKKGKVNHDEKPNECNPGFATVEEFDFGKKTVAREWSNDDLVAQAVLFFMAGFETVSSALSFLMYELAVNPDIQERLVQEIKEHDAKNGGKFNFNSIQNLTYLDMVVSELLRLWPPAIGMDRLCIKDYNMGKPNANSENDFILRKGEAILIPLYAFHRIPEFFPDPYKFDPERFSEENKHNIKPFTYLPFGAGPRNCIGSRFALCEIKVAAYHLLKEMEVMPCEKTRIPAKLDINTFTLKIDVGHWVRFRVRK